MAGDDHFGFEDLNAERKRAWRVNLFEGSVFLVALFLIAYLGVRASANLVVPLTIALGNDKAFFNSVIGLWYTERTIILRAIVEGIRKLGALIRTAYAKNTQQDRRLICIKHTPTGRKKFSTSSKN